MFLPLSLPPEIADELNSADENDCKKAIKECVQVIMFLAKDRKVIKKADVNRLAFSHSPISSRMYIKLIQAANIRLKKNFGMRLFELSDKSKYILVNASNEYSFYQKRNSVDYDEVTILFIVLIVIFMSTEQKVTYEEIKNPLAAIKLTVDEVKFWLSVFVKNLYLIEEKDQVARLYKWGPRAEAEIDPDSFVNSIEKLFENDGTFDSAELERRIDVLRNMPNR